MSLALGLKLNSPVTNAGGNAPSVLALNLDLTSSLDSRITFSSPARNYITGGVLTAITANTPTFESWYDSAGNLVNRGLALEA